MNKLPRTILYNLVAVSTFFLIYLFSIDHFVSLDGNKKPALLDLLNLSITMQTSVGNPYIKPITPFAKLMVTTQQFFLIFGNLFILHI